MKLVRSWPATIPSGRSYVVDDLPRLVMSGYDYSVLDDVGDDVLLIEWDLAVGAEELEAFAERAAGEPDRVLAGPYRLYTRHSPSSGLDPAIPPAWSAWTYARADQQQGEMVQVKPGDPVAHVVGFGLIYLPGKLIRAYLDERDPSWGFSDIAFSGWHHRRVRQEIDLDWQARPVHLHYHTPHVGSD